uniref:NADH dehydrogenase subunit 2 n=1 Tax=Cazira verrucosa TaxID=3101551 RepID=UPI002E77CC07|nr:NADH dehydrogenase subunit 2 [Cazira verrucosa]WPO01450.1 NADH dehydrogenase subunit 2 [Cazira verrucosa]
MMTLVMSTMITLSSNNWISMWIGLEINMMSFIPLILNKINKSSSEAALIYFLIQSVSSMIMMMMIFITMCNYLIPKKLITCMIMISIIIKLGAAPFHNWLPKIMSQMEWSKCCILMTWQKIAPLFMISNLNNNLLMNLIIISSVSIGSLGGLNQTSLRKMMAYSSINHLGWMLAINKTMNLWLMYLIIYSMMINSLCFMLHNYKLNFINQINSLNMTNTEKMGFFISMLSMGGMPPLIGFLPKWITIQSMMYIKEYFLIFIMIMFSLVTLMYYLRLMTYMFLTYNMSMKWSKNYYMKTINIIMIINCSLPMILIMDNF